MRRLLPLLLLTACAASQARFGEPRDEIVHLQQRIAGLRDLPQLQAGPERCEKQQKVAAEICRCSDRICVLAGSLGDDPARRACAQSREDCQRARDQLCK